MSAISKLPYQITRKTTMKSRVKKSIPLPHFTSAEIKKALEWIKTLTPEENMKFELLARVELALKVRKEYLQMGEGNRKRKRKQSGRSG